MLKQTYDTQESIPENLHGAYIQSGGKWTLDELPGDHPVVAKRDELLRENTSQKGQITRLTNEKTALEASVIPSGHVATPKADADFIEKVKPLGTSAEIETKVREHTELKSKQESREKADALGQIAAGNGYDPEKIAALEDRFPAPLFREVEVDGKKQRRAYFKTRDGDKEVERSFIEYLENDPKLKPLQDSLKTIQGTRVHGSSSNQGSQGNQKDPVGNYLKSTYAPPKPRSATT